MISRPARTVIPGVALLAAILFLAAGCATGPRGAGIESLHVFSVPVALDLDPPAGPDAFGITLYASAMATARGLPITAGRLEIQMFDGPLPTGAATNAAPRRVWTFTPAELKSHAVKTSLGTGYRLTPRWGDTPPSQGRITIIARYASPRGSIAQSAPTTITTSGQ